MVNVAVLTLGLRVAVMVAFGNVDARENVLHFAVREHVLPSC